MSLERDDPVQRSKGRPVSITDDHLLNNRDSLHSLIDCTWGNVGGQLDEKLRLSEVPDVLQSWKSYEDLYIVKALLRPSESSAMKSVELSALRKQASQLDIRIDETDSKIRALRTQLERLQRIQPDVADSVERTRLIADSLSQGRTLIQKRDLTIIERTELQERLDIYQAHFCKTQLVRFCRSGRYRLTPLNVANALAGLPFIEFRQSLRRTNQWPRKEEGMGYETYLIFRRILNSSKPEKLQANARRWIEHPDSKVSHVVLDLRRNWYYVSCAITSVLAEKVHSKQRPYAMLREYTNRKNNPSEIDRILANADCIRPRKQRKIEV